MDESTERFLRLVNERNSRIADEETQKQTAPLVSADEFRLKRDQERRERYGQLRARAKPGKRPNGVVSVFPRVDPS